MYINVQLRTNAASILQTTLLNPADHLQFKPHVIWNAYGIYNLMHFYSSVEPIVDFFDIFTCTGLNWPFLCDHNESEQTTFYHWKGWCRFPIVFFLGLIDVFWAKIMFNEHSKFTFFIVRKINKIMWFEQL